jgi:hypothetical protein
MYILTLQDSSLWHNNHLTFGVLLIKQTFLCGKQSRQLYHTDTLQNIVFRVRTSSDIPCHVSGHLLTYLVTFDQCYLTCLAPIFLAPKITFCFICISNPSDFWVYLMKVIPVFWLLSVPDEGYSSLLTFECTWWRLFQSSDFWVYLMKVIPETRRAH